MPKQLPDFLALLGALAQHDVDAIVVGGVGAVLQGAPLTTLDLDLVHSRSPDNVSRLVSTLQELDAYYREHPDKRLVPTGKLLSGPGHHLLMTSAGPLDLLGSVSGDRSYEDLLDYSVDLEILPECRIRVLDLPMLITLKEEMGRDKDRAMLPLLRHTLEERDKAGDQTNSPHHDRPPR